MVQLNVKQRKGNPMTTERNRLEGKLNRCVRFAREQYDNIKQDPVHAGEYRRIRREAMQDARYWRKLVNE